MTLSLFEIGLGVIAIGLVAYYLYILRVRKKAQDFQDYYDTIIYSDEYKIKGRFES